MGPFCAERERSCPHGHFAPSGASCRQCGGPSHVGGPPRNVVERLSGVNEPSMIILMTTSRCPQQRYDHRLRELVRGTGDVTIASDLGVPRSTARGWLRKAPTVVVSVDVSNRSTSELQQENRGAPATREDAHGTTAPRPRPVSYDQSPCPHKSPHRLTPRDAPSDTSREMPFHPRGRMITDSR
jgi:hypothetical protein